MKYDSKLAVIGKAYGFFDCSASRKKIETELPKIRKLVHTPREVDLSLFDDISNIRGDSNLMSVIEHAKNTGLKYALEASYPSASNRNAANEVATILSQTYQTHLFDEGEPFRGEIVFEENGKYVFRE